MTMLLQVVGGMKIYVYLYSIGVGGVCPTCIEASGFLMEGSWT